MRTNYDFTLSEGFVLNAVDGKLEEYKPTGITFDLKNEQIIYRGLFHDGEREINEKDFKLYKDINSYEKNISICLEKKCSVHNVYNEKLNLYRGESMTAWTFVDGKPVEINPFDYSVSYEVSNGFIQWKTMKVNIDTPLYRTYQDAVNMNDIITVDKDGNETVRTGILKALQLNDTQKELLEKFIESAKALLEANVVLGYDSDECTLFCINKLDNVDKEYYQCDGLSRVDEHVTPVNVPIREWISCDGLWMAYKD